MNTVADLKAALVKIEEQLSTLSSEKIRIEIGDSDHFVDTTVKAIINGARTGEVGDGKIFVLPVEKIYRIRTGEEDEAAITPEQLTSKMTT